MQQLITRASSFAGTPSIPGDKSISHRALILGALAEGSTEVDGLLASEDVRSTARCLQAMGVKIIYEPSRTVIHGIGPQGFTAPQEPLDCGNSGTTMRVMMGVLAGRHITATLTGDDSLVRRPMKRVAEPLQLMGANFSLTNDNFAPLTVVGGPIHAIDYYLKIASAQIKTAIIMAALTAHGTTHLGGEIGSRDHTERLLPHFGGHITVTADELWIPGGQQLKANHLNVPSDPSTAAFWIGAASIIPNAELILHNVSLNPTRIGFIHALQAMGASISTEITTAYPEPVGTITVTPGTLKGIQLSKESIPSLIDELPLFAVLASQAKGVTQVTGAEELRVKESDRLEAIAVNLRAMGCQIDVFSDGFCIEGPQTLTGAPIQSFHDHRIAMAFSIAGLVADGETVIHDAECVNISYPQFFATLKGLTHS